MPRTDYPRHLDSLFAFVGQSLSIDSTYACVTNALFTLPMQSYFVFLFLAGRT